MDGFMVAFNAEDANAIQNRWFNFPHVRFHSGRVTVSSGGPKISAARSGNERGEAKGWARTWDYVEFVDAGPDKVQFSEFSSPRYRTEAMRWAITNPFYGVTCKEWTVGYSRTVKLGRRG